MRFVPRGNSMPDMIADVAGTEAADTRRLEILRSATELLRRTNPALPPAAGDLLVRMYAAISTAELADRPPETMAAAAADLWSLASQREHGTARIRVRPLVHGAHARAVVQIVNDDMPFLVDTALATLSDMGGVVHELLHPVLALERDAGGRLIGLDAAAGARRE